MYKLDQDNQIFLKLAECYELLDSDDESRSAEYGFDFLVGSFLLRIGQIKLVHVQVNLDMLLRLKFGQ